METTFISLPNVGSTLSIQRITPNLNHSQIMFAKRSGAGAESKMRFALMHIHTLLHSTICLAIKHTSSSP